MIRTAMLGAAALLVCATGVQACPAAKAAVDATISTADTTTDFSSQSTPKKKAAKRAAKPGRTSGGGSSGGGAPSRNNMDKPSSY